MNNQPFYIGQRVVCVKGDYIFKKNEIYTVNGLGKCPSCGLWHVSILETPFPRTGIMHCTKCDANVINPSNYWGTDHTAFSPIERERIVYVSVSESLKEKAKETILESSLNN